jgi:hypothetical protein
MLEITDIIDKLPCKPDDPNRRTRSLSAITKIVVHYDAVRVPPAEGSAIAYDPVARYVAQANYHIAKNWNEGAGPVVHGFGLMYHDRYNPHRLRLGSASYDSFPVERAPPRMPR